MKLWIARDKDGDLNLFVSKPEKDYLIEDSAEKTIFVSDGEFLALPSNSFPEITFENSPQQVEITLCNTNFDSVVEKTKVVKEMTYKEKYPRYRSSSDAPEVVEEEGYEYYWDDYDELPCAYEEQFWKEYIEHMESFGWEFVQAVDWGYNDDTGYSNLEVTWRKKITVKQDNNGNQD